MLLLRRVGEAMQLDQVEGAVAVLDVAEDAAGADRGVLLVITDQSDTRTGRWPTGRRCLLWSPDLKRAVRSPA